MSKFLTLTALSIFIISCSSGESVDTPILEESPKLELVKEILPTPTPIPEPTPTPTPTPIPEPTPTPTPTPIPEPTGPLKIETIMQSNGIRVAQSEVASMDLSLSVEFQQGTIKDYVQFTIPDGMFLEELILNKFEGDDPQAFYGIKEGCCEMWEPAEQILSELSAWGHFNKESHLDQNILSYSAISNSSDSLPSEFRTYINLRSGVYTMLFQNGNTDNANYEFILKLNHSDSK